MHTLEIYTQALDLAQRILDQAGNGQKLNVLEVKENASRLVQSILQSPDDFLQYSIRSTPENFLIAHSVNCMILAVLIGQGLGYPVEKLEMLAVTALLHDIGMLKMADVVNSSLKFSKMERDEIEKHSVLGAEIIEQLKDFDALVVEAILQHHEDNDGGGYPAHLEEKGIHELASVIHVVDVYEALSHPRPYRNALLPHLAIKETIDLKKKFNRRVLKALLDVVSLFPLGTYVVLNTKAIGKVIKMNKISFMRPTIRMIMDHEGRPLPDDTIVDLVKDINIYVERCLDENEILKLIVDPEQFVRINKKQREDNDT